MTKINVSALATFRTSAAALNDDKVKEFTMALATGYDKRAADEKAKNIDNDNIQKTLNGLRAKYSKGSIGRFLMVCNVSESLMNVKEKENAARNVYTLDKIVNIAGRVMLGDEVKMNDINRCIIRSMVNCEKAGIEFKVKLIGQACASDKIAVDAGVRKHLVRHTVAASTAATQTSSTLSALEIVGAVEIYKNEAGADCARFKEGEIAAAVKEAFGAV